MIHVDYNSHEVILMAEKEKLHSIIDRLTEENVNTLQKVAEAMYFAQGDENLPKLSKKVFSEWDNEEDDVYNDL